MVSQGGWEVTLSDGMPLEGLKTLDAEGAEALSGYQGMAIILTGPALAAFSGDAVRGSKAANCTSTA